MADVQTTEIFIPSLIPYFLEKDVFWFAKNSAKIKQAILSQPWWQRNILILCQGQNINPFSILRQLDELGYEKTASLDHAGQFSHRGGIIDIYPICQNFAYRFEWRGNIIESIKTLEIVSDKSKKQIDKILQKQSGSDLLRFLRENDYIVHLDHGIAHYRGIKKEPIPGTDALTDYYILEYAKGDKLSVPLNMSKKLSLYFGLEKPKLHRLGGIFWEHAKEKAKESAEKLANELLKLYASRELARGFAYPPADAMEREIAEAFTHIETQDQERAINEVMHDMESDKKMDRLICGDVGFGKTEVALRAAVKSAFAGKQTILLCPTTILARQHANTFTKRLAHYPIKVKMLSRLESKAEQTKIIEQMKNGKVDIVIGTHRLLSKDVHFKDLGLLIIDEEQRFGVKQKEKIKKLKLGVDILSLSATPIPRTLKFTLAGLRDVSLISTPPPGRLSIKTHVLPYKDKIVKKAIREEIDRGGQVYFLHNVILNSQKIADKIKKLVKGAKVEILHAKLPDRQIMDIMDKMQENKINVLVATTIIENGLDLPNVNTLIVDDASRLGLAQSHQLRGRIGRSHRQAVAYFLYPEKTLDIKATLRLDALRDLQELGSGYLLAMRDLEIRGAGNILGKKQSGHANAVGLNLYCQMLAQTIEQLKAGVKYDALVE